MKNRFYFYITILLFAKIFAQSALPNLDNLSNAQIDQIRKASLSNSEANSQDQIQIDNNKFTKPSEVKLESLPGRGNEEFFGYSFFNRSINFFDNIPTPANFKLAAGDEIVLSLWGETNSRESFVLNKNGSIYYSNIGFINLSNKTIKEAELLLSEKLISIYSTLQDKETQLDVELGKTKSINVYFTGQVTNPGISLVHPFTDVFSALVQSGGINSNGSLRNVKLIRNGKTYNIYDFYSFFLSGIDNFSSDRLLDGDIIHIPQVEKRVEIRGAVNSPSFFELLPNENYKDLLNYASGYTKNASSIISVIQIIPISSRDSDDVARKSLNLKRGDELNTLSINNGDRFIVNSITTNDISARILGRVKNPGEYQIPDNYSLKSLLNLAGGFQDPNYVNSINLENIVILRKSKNTVNNLEFSVNYADADNFIVEPNDTIIVYRDSNYMFSKTFSISGEVNFPGSYQVIKGLKIGDAIINAGGYTSFANEEVVKITINGSQLNNFFLDSEVLDGMEITIPPLIKTIEVSGNVFNPGILDISSKKLTIAGAIQASGGLKESTKRNKIIVTNANGRSYKPSFLQKQFKRLDYGDVISVPTKERDLDITQLVSDVSNTLANLLAIFIIIDRVNDTN
jgi:protein involved in polysaccharide export with SLBB domain